MTSSVERYPDTGFFIIATSSSTPLGSFEMAEGSLEHCELRCFNRRSGAYSYTLTLKISTTLGGPAVATSDAFTFDNATTGQTTTDHLVNIVMTFSTSYDLKAGETYFIRAETTGYTRDENVGYLGYWCDWFEPLGPGNTSAAKIAFGVRR